MGIRSMTIVYVEVVIEPDGPVPPYLQLVEILAERIERGDWQPNRPIPSETQLTQEFGIARGTVRRAIAVLRERSLVFTVPQRGTYVAPSSGAPPE
jgi:GntR family transcriptional regulator